MNAPIVTPKLSVRAADLRDANEMARLDDWILAQAEATPFHRPKWLAAVEKGAGQKAHMLVAEYADGTIAGLLPLTLVASPLFGRALVSSGFAVGGGILAHDSKAAQALADAAAKMAGDRNCPTVELRGGPIPAQWIEKRDAHANFCRSLAADDEAELLAIPRKQRAEVRKGVEKGLRIETGYRRRDRDWHYAVYSESVRNLGTPVFPKKLFAAVLDAFGDQADILTVLDGDRPVASVLSFYHNGTVMPFWGGGVWDARRLRANDVMYYALMNHARARDCTAFDFGRSKVDSGAYAFKKNWGFEPEPLAYALWAADGEEPRDINPNSPKYRMQIKLWQKLPLPVANMLGPWIAKGLG